MRLALCLAALSCASATPPYFASVANGALRIKGDAVLGPLDTVPIDRLEQQVKRVMGADPSLPLNMSQVAGLPEQALLRILLLAVIGNFTSSAAAAWQQPCSLVVDPSDGSFVLDGGPGRDAQAIKAVVILLLIVQFAVWAQTALREATKTGQAPQKAA